MNSYTDEELVALTEQLTEDSTRWLPSPQEPMAVARIIAADAFVSDGERTLRHWRGGWWRWHGTDWAEEENRKIRAELYEFTENAYYMKQTQSGPSPEPWNPTRYKIANLSEALSAVLHLSESTQQPCWIGDATTPAGVLVACANGLLHVESRSLHPHTPRWFSQTHVPFEYEEEAREPKRWLSFLKELWPDDPASIAALQEFFGYTISGRLDMQKMLLLVGPTRGGKGTITRVLGALVGKRNVAGPTLSSLSTDFGLAPLLGKPLAVVSDARLDARNSSVVVERLLSISGEDTLTVNIKYREQWTGKLPTRFVILSNELPRFGDASAAIIGRFVALQLQRSWLGKEDLDLEPALQAELPAILSWSLDGLERLTATRKFSRPSYHDDMTITLADLASPVAAFVREECEHGQLLEVPADDLYRAWKSWAEDNGQRAITAQTFGRNLRAAVPNLRVRRPRGSGSDRQRWYVGIALNNRH